MTKKVVLRNSNHFCPRHLNFASASATQEVLQTKAISLQVLTHKNSTEGYHSIKIKIFKTTSNDYKVLWVSWRDQTPAGKVRHKIGKNCAIDKYFGIHIKNCAIVMWKSCIYYQQLYVFSYICPDIFNNFEIPFLLKKMPKTRPFFWLVCLLMVQKKFLFKF